MRKMVEIRAKNREKSQEKQGVYAVNI